MAVVQHSPFAAGFAVSAVLWIFPELSKDWRGTGYEGWDINSRVVRQLLFYFGPVTTCTSKVCRGRSSQAVT